MLGEFSTSLGLREAESHEASTARALHYVFASALEGEDRLAYDAVIERGSYAQTRAWADVACAGSSSKLGAVKGRFFLARRDGDPIGGALVLTPTMLGIPAPTAIVPRGPVARSLDDLGDVVRALRLACRARGIVRLRVMPYWSGEESVRAERILEGAGFRSVQTFASAHARTLRVPLAGRSEHEVLGGREHRSLRAELRRAARAGATARRGGASDMIAFERMHGDLMRRQGLAAKPRSWFVALARLLEQNAALFVCEVGRAIVSAVFVTRHGSLVTYVAGATAPAPSSFSKTAPAMAAAIHWAYAQGANALDLGGVPLDGDPDPKRQNIARFKRSFACAPISLTREHERWF